MAKIAAASTANVVNRAGKSQRKAISNNQGLRRFDLVIAGPLLGGIGISQVMESARTKHPQVKLLDLCKAIEDQSESLPIQQSALIGRFTSDSLRRAVGGILGSPSSLAVGKRPAEPIGPRTVLVVEHDDKFRRLLDLSLAVSGYVVRDACSAFGALQLIREHQIDLLIVHVRLAEISGADLARALCGQNPQARVLFISDAADNFRESFPRCTFIRKPFTPDELAQKASKVLNA